MLEQLARDTSRSAPPLPPTDGPSAPLLTLAEPTAGYSACGQLERLEQLQVEMDELLLDCARILVSCAKYCTSLLF